MSNFRFFISFIFILNLISIILCQFESDSMTKAIACMAVLNQKLKGGDPDPNIYSSMMLKCFVTITVSQSKKILTSIETGSGNINKKEVNKLTDYNTLKNMSPKELERKSNELEKALKKFKKMQEDFTKEGGDIDPSDYDDEYYDDDENFDTETPNNINYFGLIPKGIYGIFNVFNSYISLFIIFLIVYFGLLLIRKINDSEKKMKKKKKKEDEFEEDEEEEYEPEINENLKNQNTKSNKNNKKNGKEKEIIKENKNDNKKEKNE